MYFILTVSVRSYSTGQVVKGDCIISVRDTPPNKKFRMDGPSIVFCR